MKLKDDSKGKDDKSNNNVSVVKNNNFYNEYHTNMKKFNLSSADKDIPINLNVVLTEMEEYDKTLKKELLEQLAIN